MVKLVYMLFALFCLSCGNPSGTTQNKSSTSKEKIESTPIESVDSISSNTQEQEEENISVTEVVQQDVEDIKKTTEKTEQTLRPKEVVQEKPKTEEKMIVLPDHSPWNGLLAKYVNNKGDVNYKGFQNDVSTLNEYLNQLAENSPEKGWSKNERLAYYINLYNSATVKLILDNYPTNSIKDIKDPWGQKRVETGDELISIGDIENQILRKMNEPRIHFAINCASVSCPKLLNKAFEASRMEKQLNEVTSDFINDETRNNISSEKLELSNLFEWYKEDFTKNGSLTDYVKPYTDIDINADTDVEYLKYDWNLNEAK